jgi:replicative DNA helicase
MKIVEKAFLGSLMKAEYLLKDTVIQPEQLESQLHQHLMRRMIELMKSCYRTRMLRNSTESSG